MRRAFVVSLSAFAVIAFAGAAYAQDAKAAEKGKQIYADKKCSVCHSIEGKGNAKGPLDGIGSKLSAAELKQWIVDPKGMAAKTKAERKPPMPSTYATMPAADIDALVAYLQTLKKK